MRTALETMHNYWLDVYWVRCVKLVNVTLSEGFLMANKHTEHWDTYICHYCDARYDAFRVDATFYADFYDYCFYCHCFRYVLL